MGSINSIHSPDLSSTEKGKLNTELLEILVETMDNLGHGFVYVSADARILYANHAFCSLSGYSLNELEAMDYICTLIVEQDREKIRARREARFRDEPAESHYETQLIRKDGVLRDIDVAVNKVALEEESGLVTLIRDITPRKNAERIARQLEQQILQIHKMECVGHLAAGIVHDFNNTLAIVNGNLELAKESLAQLITEVSKENCISYHIQELAESLDAAYTGGTRASETIQWLKTMTQHQILTLNSVNLNNIVCEVAQLLTKGFSSTVKYSVTCDGKAEHRVLGDESQLFDIINNLAINSHDAMPEGGNIHLGVHDIALTSEKVTMYSRIPAGNYVQLSVSDTGTGITSDVAQRMFEPLFSTKGKGRGMGLSMVWSAVQQHKGYIDVSSEIGNGTTFHIYFPAIEDKSKPTKRIIYFPPKQSGRIFVVDDEESIRIMLKRTLEREGHAITTAASGEEALQMYQPDQYDLFITDVIMNPGMNGGELSIKIREIDPAVPILYISGYHSDDGIRYNIRNGIAVGQLSKPLKLQEFSDTVMSILAGRQK